MNILITGCAGFIGFHLSKKLLENNKKDIIFGIDNLNTYYDISLKRNRLKILKQNSKFKFTKLDIFNEKKLNFFFKTNKFDIVINLAAQAGVRYSITNPKDYLNSNILGFYNIITACKNYKIKHLIFASTSSVYGDNKSFPLDEEKETSKPISFYAATKKTNEIIAHSFNKIYNLKSTALRFFTVYGPYGRPDMALFKFTKSIIEEKKINLHNYGNHVRDFTYIDDVVNLIQKIIYSKNKINNFSIYNICSNEPLTLNKFLKIIENKINKKAKINFTPLQLGDVYKTHGDNKKISKKFNLKIKSNHKINIGKFIDWYLKYYRIQ